jgi:hypothetical protein
VPTKEPRRGQQDPLACRILVFGRVSHRCTCA